MLWRKAWLECRLRTILCLLVSAQAMISVFLLVSKRQLEKSPGISADALGEKVLIAFVLVFGAVAIPICGKVLAGAGVNTQTSWGMMRGFHASMYFLLSLPISRSKLLWTRAGMGGGITFGIALLSWLSCLLVAPLAGVNIDTAKLVAAFPKVVVIGALFYCQAVRLSSFLDEFWSGTIALTILGFFLGYSAAEAKVFGDLFYFLSPASTGVPAWHWLLYLAISAAFLYAARWVVERKEY